MTGTSRPTIALIHRPTATRDSDGNIVLSADTDGGTWSRVLSARAARVLWDGLTTHLFAAAGEKFIHVAQTALFQPPKDATVTDWIQISPESSGLIAVRGLSTQSLTVNFWIAHMPLADAQPLWRALEGVLFAEVRGRPRPQPAAPAPAGLTRRSFAVPAETRVKLSGDDYAGGDPPLLFVHGAFCDRSVWRYQIASFAPEHRSVILDLRGHGGSDKPPGSYWADILAADLDRVIEALDLKAPIVIAHSLGASAAMHLAAHHPRRALAGLALVEPAAIVDDRQAELYAEFGLGREDDPRFPDRFKDRVRDLTIDLEDPQLADPLRRLMLATPPHVAAGLDEALFFFSTGPVAARVQVPALVLLAAHRFEDARFFRRLMPAAEVHVLEDDSHFPMLLTPGRVNAALAEFFQSLESRS